MKDYIDIIGAGIGGLTLAMMLQRRDQNFTLFESAAQLRSFGSGILLANNAMTIFKELHLLDKIEKEGSRINRLKISDPQLKTLSTLDLNVFEKKYKVPTIAIQRGELHKILSAEVDLKDVKFSKRLSKIRETESFGYELEFEDQSKNLSRTLIGADGIYSMVRDQVFGKGVLRKPGQLCWRGVASMDLPIKYTHVLTEAWGKGKRFGFVQVGEGKIYWYALINEYNLKKPFEEVQGRFENFHPLVMEIIHATQKERIIMNEIMDLHPMNQWQNGKVCLIGDAAHAMTPNLGQGTCQAIEDAYVLGKLLTESRNVQDAFRRFELERIKKVNMLVDKSWRIGKLAQMENQLAVWFRNRLMEAIPNAVNKRQMNKIYTFDTPVSV